MNCVLPKSRNAPPSIKPRRPSPSVSPCDPIALLPTISPQVIAIPRTIPPCFPPLPRRLAHLDFFSIPILYDISPQFRAATPLDTEHIDLYLRLVSYMYQPIAFSHTGFLILHRNGNSGLSRYRARVLPRSSTSTCTSDGQRSNLSYRVHLIDMHRQRFQAAPDLLERSCPIVIQPTTVILQACRSPTRVRLGP